MTEVLRYGEAEHPGPFVVSTFNPAQLLGKKEDIASFVDGIWTASEMNLSSAVRQKGIRTEASIEVKQLVPQS